MADNAIDKLFDEIRATCDDLNAIQDAVEALDEQRRELKARHIEAINRRDILDVTLRKHIYTGMPIVQAKMQAHEELSNSRDVPSFNLATKLSPNRMGAAIQVTNGTIVTGNI